MRTIEGIALVLDSLYKQIEGARNKILAHNDRSIFAKGLPLGGFPNGRDEDYFLALSQLCTIIWNKFPNRNWPYGDRAFVFTRTGMCGDSLCPSNDARELRKLIVGSFLKAPDDIDRL